MNCRRAHRWRRRSCDRFATVLIGVIGGFAVGLTSVGSGSLMIVMLMFLYPTLSGREMVGTDLVQAIPLVASAAIGHLIFGDLQFGLTSSVLVGAIPGVYVGARISAHRERPVHPARADRRADDLVAQADRCEQRVVARDHDRVASS